MIVAGCDVGSTTGKVVIMSDGEIVGTSLIPATPVSRKTAEISLEKALADTGLSRDDIQYTVGTGYGRVNIPFATKNITEISCHGKGAFWANPDVHLVIDIGGQDCKVIRIDDKGKVRDFMMNDKCAAGTGRFLEDISKVLQISLEELGPVSLKAENIEAISSQCSVFAASEVVSLLKRKKPVSDIAAGLNDSVASRLVAMVQRVGLVEKLLLSGGVSKNVGVVDLIQKRLGVELASIPYDAQLLGAIGAALFARERLAKKMEAN